MSQLILTASDSFASGSLNANWAGLSNLSMCQVIAGSPNYTEPNVLSTSAAQVWNTAWSPDQGSEATIKALTTEAGTYVFLFVRGLHGFPNNSYQLNVQDNFFRIYKNVAGTQTALTGNVAATISAGDIVRFVVIGSTLYAYHNGTLITSITDTSLTAGKPGFGQYSTTNITHTQVSSWRGYAAGINWSPIDCRDYATFPNTGVVQPSAAVFYTGQTSSNSAVPGVDSREAGASVDSRTVIPQNSRNAPPF